MTDTVTTRIRLPGEVHRDVKAEAARRGINLDEALGMCVAYLAHMVRPLQWLDDPGAARSMIEGFALTGSTRL